MRIARRLSRKAVAADAGIDASYLAALEKGNRNPPSQEKLEKLLAIFSAGPKERERLQIAAYLARLQDQKEDVPLYLRDTVQIIKALPQLSSREIRIIRHLVDAMISENILMETDM